MKFRKKPVVIEAEQFSAISSRVQKGVCGYGRKCPYGYNLERDGLHVHTIHNNQIVTLEDGDWVVPEPDGEHFYPVKDNIFKANYEAAD